MLKPNFEKADGLGKRFINHPLFCLFYYILQALQCRDTFLAGLSFWPGLISQSSQADLTSLENTSTGNKFYTLGHILSKCALKYNTKYVLKYQLHYLQVFSCHEKCGLVHGSVYSKFDCICPSISLLHEVRHYRFMFEFTYVSMILARVYRLAQ